jgi:endoglucanase Acf2
MKLAEGTGFTTKTIFPGVLPWLPDTGALAQEKLVALLAPELAAKGTESFRDTYWEGKQLGRTATLSALADSAGLGEQSAKLRNQLRAKLEPWFTASDASGAKKKGVFACEPAWGTLIGYPASYGSDDQLNDHHFHYGYFIKAAAEVARRDPAWADDARWGGMVKLLIRDIANPRRDDPQFPFLRALDPYAGHSWASGHSRFGDGNNNESSSEAMNAWAGIVLFGEATGDRALRDLGIYLFTTELSAIEDYWFGVHGDTFPVDYPASVVTMVWGGKGANATWFSGDPEMIHGINWLPITGASLYLGRFPDYVEKNYAALVAGNLEDDTKKAAKAGKPAPATGTSWSAWADIIWMYRALSDPADAIAQYETAVKSGKVPMEAGNSEPAVAHWLHGLAVLGRVDRSVTADYPLYAVFFDGKKRTHAAYNSTTKPITVKFSDGVMVAVEPGNWATK